MKAFKVNMKDLFLMNGYDSEGNKTFDDSKKKLLIPKYQREYGWKDEKVKDLLADVAEHEKFLGFLILNEKDNHYEIVDGQQRLTTCFLILLSLYNAYENQPLERSDIKQIIRPVEDQIIFDHAHKGADLAREILGELGLTDGTETDMICSAIYHHDDKLVVDSPMDEVLKDADVIHHCMNDLSKPIKEKEQARFDKLCAEFGM